MIVIVAAIRDELAGFLAAGRYHEPGRHGPARLYESARWPGVAVVIGGVGREGAMTATSAALERYQPDLVVSAGFAGGIAPGLSAGDLVLCDRVWSIEGLQDGDSLNNTMSRKAFEGVPTGWLAEIAALAGIATRRGGCLSMPELVSSSKTKRLLGRRFQVTVVDMESYWVVETAACAGAGSIVVRSVLDPMERTLPPLVANLIGAGVAARWMRGLAYAAGRPGSIPDLVDLARETAAARDALGKLLELMASTPRPWAEAAIAARSANDEI